LFCFQVEVKGHACSAFSTPCANLRAQIKVQREDLISTGFSGRVATSPFSALQVKKKGEGRGRSSSDLTSINSVILLVRFCRGIELNFPSFKIL
jgi:hypothetical protein